MEDCSQLLKSVYVPLGTHSPKMKEKINFNYEISSELENENENIFENDVNIYLG